MKFYVLGALLIVVAVAATLVYIDGGTWADFLGMFAGNSDIETSSDPDGIPIFFTMLTIYSAPALAVYTVIVVVIQGVYRARSARHPNPSH